MTIDKIKGERQTDQELWNAEDEDRLIEKGGGGLQSNRLDQILVT